ncbi:MAG TPA: hypothetical protein VMY76_03105, partial [Gemmatimonadales bacterium]|nr:hypothetical protein [Gemmatimonadales bacterium]
ATALTAQSKPPSSIVAPATARQAYLAHATIWQPPPTLSPAKLLEGPSGVFPYRVSEATAADGISCVFTRPGVSLGGKSAKFTCRTADQHDVRVKYWNVETQSGNREAFATVAATRLMWALGFPAAPALPLNVQCTDCPEDPMHGTGERRSRRFLGMWQVSVPGVKILSTPDSDQGWSWRELEEAVGTLPAGEERTQQRTRYAALVLLGVLLQHGDRKPEQQALYCEGPPDVSAGEIRTPGNGDTHQMLFERADTRACAHAVAAVVDVGATFGGAGRTSNAITAKMNLENWAKKPVFSGNTGECRGELSISLAAGGGGNAHPRITEEGRQFLAERLHQLTDEHLRAIFTAARVDQLHHERPSSGTAVEAWVTAFKDKIKQIDARHCQPGA